jgi:prepilin-type N-terminal cleavage/methylation domain-containing protein
MTHLLAVHKRSQNKIHQGGFTFTELLVVIVMVSILSAIAVPSFFGFLQKAKVNNGLAKLQGALQEAQRQAVRKSQDCTVTFPSSGTLSNVQIFSSCFVASDGVSGGVPFKQLSNVQIRHNDATAPYSLTFNFRGNTDLANELVFTISNTDADGFQRCLVVSPGIGLMRMGNYPGNNINTPTLVNCTPTQ